MATPKTTTRRRTVPEPEPEPRAEPLIVLRRTRKPGPEPAEQVLVFAFEYDDGTEPREFWVPKRKMASLALRYFRMVRAEGEDPAMAWLLEEVLGTAAYEALMEDEELEEADLTVIFTAVQNVVLGVVADPKERRR